MPVKAAAPKDIDEYLARLPADQRAALTKVRRTIKAAAPGATESISYRLPTFKLDGERLAYFGGAKAHCALYGLGAARFARELKGFDAHGGTIRFTPDKPLPATLLTKLIKARVAEIKKGA
jgi:uncharacterized protein YdhG (YjbR/CyaY superfamily)